MEEVAMSVSAVSGLIRSVLLKAMSIGRRVDLGKMIKNDVNNRGIGVIVVCLPIVRPVGIKR